MRNILKGLLDPEAYRFPSAEELELEAESPPEAPGEEEACEDIAAPPGEEAALEEEAPPSGEEARAAAPQEQHTGPVQYAQLQAELILKQAREEAEQLLTSARAAAKAEQEEIRMGARDEGYREGYAQGIGKAMAVHAMRALQQEHINKVCLIAFKKNEVGNSFWKSVGWTFREDLNYYDFALNDENITTFQ